MGMGLGKQYWVRLVKYYYGNLESCIQFMKDNPPENNYYWYELRPMAKVKRGTRTTCEEYQCSLVTDGSSKYIKE